MLLALKRHLPLCLVLMRQKIDLGRRWRGCTWSGNNALPCSLLSQSTLGVHFMQPSTLSTASCPKRGAMLPGASGHTKPSAQFSPWMEANIQAQFCGDETRRICHQLMYRGCVWGGGPSRSGGEVWLYQSIWQPDRMATNHKADRLIYYLNSWRLPQAEKIKSSQRVKQTKKASTSVFGADWESGKRSSPASQDDGGTNRASGFGKWLFVTVAMKWKPLISNKIGKKRTLLYEQGGSNLSIYKCLGFSAVGLTLKMCSHAKLPQCWGKQSQGFLPLQWS